MASQTQNDVPTTAPQEGKFTKAVEQQTAKMPSLVFLSLAGGAMVLSAGLALWRNKQHAAIFTGLWVPSFLLLGLYNKLVKLEGSDMRDRTWH